jgi:hypothetical protein
MNTANGRVLEIILKGRALLQEIKKFKVMIGVPILCLAIWLVSYQIAIAVPSGFVLGSAMFNKCFIDEGKTGEEGKKCCAELAETCENNCKNIYTGDDIATCEDNCLHAGGICASGFEEESTTDGRPTRVDTLQLITEEKKPTSPKKRFVGPTLEQNKPE